MNKEIKNLQGKVKKYNKSLKESLSSGDSEEAIVAVLQRNTSEAGIHLIEAKDHLLDGEEVKLVEGFSSLAKAAVLSLTMPFEAASAAIKAGRKSK